MGDIDGACEHCKTIGGCDADVDSAARIYCIKDVTFIRPEDCPYRNEGTP